MKTNFLKLAKLAAKISDDKKCQDILLLNVRKLTAMADYFLIATAGSSPQMNAVVTTIEKDFKEAGAPPPTHREGRGLSTWAVLDYGGLIIHIMNEDSRRFYLLEKIWSEAKKIAI